MKTEHPITPPPELVEQWLENTRSQDCIGAYPANYEQLICTQAARWGADQELEACCEWLHSSLPGYDKHYADYLRASRRPKPPSLKELALAELELLRGDANAHGLGFDAPAIRQALELLND
jgi:hypothetical protein